MIIEAENPVSPIQNGNWTIIDKTTGEHRTFRIWTETWKDRKTGREKKVRVVGLLVGKDNEKDYANFATVSDDGRNIWVWNRFKSANQQITKFQNYARIIEDIRTNDGKRWGHKFELRGSGHCCRCNRKLTRPTSIKSGIGSKCASLQA